MVWGLSSAERDIVKDLAYVFLVKRVFEREGFFSREIFDGERAHITKQVDVGSNEEVYHTYCGSELKIDEDSLPFEAAFREVVLKGVYVCPHCVRSYINLNSFNL